MMRTTIEISMYPLRDDFRPPIDAFIAALRADPALAVTVGPTSTVIVGDYEPAMAQLQRAIAASHAAHGSAVFVTKIIPGNPPICAT